METQPEPRWWNRKVPLDIQTLVFCVLEGCLLSIPVSALTKPIREAANFPDWITLPATIFVLGSFLLLPIWSLFCLGKKRGLRRLGIYTFIVLIIVGMLFPGR